MERSVFTLPSTSRMTAGSFGMIVGDVIFSMHAAMNFCWRLMRPMSPSSSR